MRHSQLLYGIVADYKDGMRHPLTHDRNILCYGKPKSGKTSTVGIPFFEQAVKAGESIILCAEKEYEYLPAIDEAKTMYGYEVFKTTVDRPSVPQECVLMQDQEAYIDTMIDLNIDRLTQEMDRLNTSKAILLIPYLSWNEPGALDICLLTLAGMKDEGEKVFGDRTLNLLIDAPFYQFTTCRNLQYSPDTRFCMIFPSDFADPSIRAVRSKTAGRRRLHEECEYGFYSLMKAVQAVICTGISGISPKVHKQFVDTYIDSEAKLRGRYLIAEDMICNASDAPITIAGSRFKSLATAKDVLQSERMEMQFRLIEETISNRIWVVLQNDSVKTSYLNGLYLPAVFRTDEDAIAWLYAHLRNSRLTNAYYGPRNDGQWMVVNAELSDGQTTKFCILQISDSNRERYRTMALDEALELMEMDDALAVHPEDDPDGSAQLDRLEELLANEPEFENTCPEEYRYKPYKPAEDEEDIPVVQSSSLPKSHVIFLGGHPNMVKKIRQLYPGWKYVFDDELRSKTFSPNDVIFFWTGHSSHKMMRYVYSRIPDSGNVIFVTATNIELLVDQMTEQYNLLLKEKNRT